MNEVKPTEIRVSERCANRISALVMRDSIMFEFLQQHMEDFHGIKDGILGIRLDITVAVNPTGEVPRSLNAVKDPTGEEAS